jgi:hypothetical protein
MSEDIKNRILRFNTGQKDFNIDGNIVKPFDHLLVFTCTRKGKISV